MPAGAASVAYIGGHNLWVSSRTVVLTIRVSQAGATGKANVKLR